MFRRRYLQGATLFALLAPSVFGSCVADSVSLRITCDVVPEADCTYSEGGLCLLGGSLNLAARRTYDGVLRVVNGLKPRARDVPPQSEPNGVAIYELEIEIRDSAGRKPNLGNLPNPYTVPATGSADPEDEALVGAELIPAVYVDRIAQYEGTSRALGTARLSIIARGRTSGDVSVESQAWEWPVRLVSRSVDPAAGECYKKEEQACQIGQDTDAITCVQTGDEGT